MHNTKHLLLLLFCIVYGQQSQFQGQLELMVSSARPESFTPHQVLGSIETSDGMYNLIFHPGVDTKSLTSRILVLVTGRLLGMPREANITFPVRYSNRPVVEALRVEVLNRQENSRQMPSRLNVAVILVATRDKQPVADVPTATQYMDQVNQLYLESSWNQLGFNLDTDGNGQTDVFGPYTIDFDPDTCDFSLWGDTAKQMAETEGVPVGLYTHFVYIMNSYSPCGAAGWGLIGCYPNCISWVFLSYPDIIAHELGHNIGMHHASSDYNNDKISDSEYGDTSCIMGYSGVPLRHFNAVHKELVGWIPANNIINGIDQNGTHTISALSAPLSNYPVSLKMPIDGDNYVVSFRSTLGFDSNLQLYYPTFYNRISIHREGYYGYSYIIGVLDVGETYTVGAATVHFLGFEDQLAQVQISFGKPAPPPIPCSARYLCQPYSVDYNYADCVNNLCVCVETFSFVDGKCACDKAGVYWTQNGIARCLTAGQCTSDWYGPGCQGPCRNIDSLGIGQC